MGVRVPLGQLLARRHFIAVTHQDGGAVGDLVALTLPTVGIDHAHFTGTRHRHQQVVLVGHGLEVVHTHRAGRARVHAFG